MLIMISFTDVSGKAALTCLLRLLPTMFKFRVSASSAMRYILEVVEVFILVFVVKVSTNLQFSLCTIYPMTILYKI